MKYNYEIILRSHSDKQVIEQYHKDGNNSMTGRDDNEEILLVKSYTKNTLLKLANKRLKKHLIVDILVSSIEMLDEEDYDKIGLCNWLTAYKHENKIHGLIVK